MTNSPHRVSDDCGLHGAKPKMFSRAAKSLHPIISKLSGLSGWCFPAKNVTFQVSILAHYKSIYILWQALALTLI